MTNHGLAYVLRSEQRQRDLLGVQYFRKEQGTPTENPCYSSQANYYGLAALPQTPFRPVSGVCIVKKS